MSAYNIEYSKEVRPRYKTDYTGKPYIITRDKAQVDIIRKNYRGEYTIAKIDEETFIIWLEEQI